MDIAGLTIWNQGDLLSVCTKEILSCTLDKDRLIYSVKVELACHNIYFSVIFISEICLQIHFFWGVSQDLSSCSRTPVLESKQREFNHYLHYIEQYVTSLQYHIPLSLHLKISPTKSFPRSRFCTFRSSMLSFSSCPTTEWSIQPRAGHANIYFSHLPTSKKVCSLGSVGQEST